MRTKLLTFILLGFAIKAISQQSNEMKFIVALKDRQDLFSPCGFEASAYVIQFELIKCKDLSRNFDNRKIRQKHLNAIVICPELYGDNFFTKDKLYILTTKPKKEFSGIIFNIELLNKNGENREFWVESIKVVE